MTPFFFCCEILPPAGDSLSSAFQVGAPATASTVGAIFADRIGCRKSGREPKKCETHYYANKICSDVTSALLYCIQDWAVQVIQLNELLWISTKTIRLYCVPTKIITTGLHAIICDGPGWRKICFCS